MYIIILYSALIHNIRVEGVMNSIETPYNLFYLELKVQTKRVHRQEEPAMGSKVVKVTVKW